MNSTTASAASRGALKVITARYDNMHVIMACRTVDDFMAVTRIPRGMINGESGNYTEKEVAMANIGVPFARPVKDYTAPFVEWTKPPSSATRKRGARR